MVLISAVCLKLGYMKRNLCYSKLKITDTTTFLLVKISVPIRWQFLAGKQCSLILKDAFLLIRSNLFILIKCKPL